MDERRVLREASELIRRGDRQGAQQRLVEILRANPRSETAWLWMAAIERDPARQREYASRVLRLDPQNARAQQILAQLDEQAAASPAPICPSCGQPVRADARFCTHCGHRMGSDQEPPEADQAGQEVDPIAAKLEAARRDLLDMSLYNRLLNYRPLRSKGVEFVDADPATVYRVLVVEGRKMSFLPAADEPAAEEDEPDEAGPTDGEIATEARGGEEGPTYERGSTAPTDEGTAEQRPGEGEPQEANIAAKGRYYEQPGAAAEDEATADKGEAEASGTAEGEVDEGAAAAAGTNEEAGGAAGTDEGAERRAENKLQTPYPEAALQKRLLNTYYAARTYVEEQGVNTLFVALGMLRWYESPDSETARLAPLILVPVELDRTNVQARFRIQYSGDEIGDNLSLRAKLGTEFGCTLPALPETEDVDVGAYTAQVQEAIAHLPRWSVDTGIVVMGFFSFGKFLMFHDLHPANWPEDAAPAAHPIVEALLQEGFAEPDPSVPDGTRIDESIPPARLHQVVDADSSQTLAALDVAEGRNLAIQGPPGTGKSQTITNIVAEAIAAGQTVLFVSEKMAALEVVKRRLDNVGLGDACLELHSQKTRKTLVLEDLRHTLELGRPKAGAAVDLGLLGETRARLNAYCDAVNEPVGLSGITPYRAYGELLALQHKLGELALPAMDGEVTRDWAQAAVERAAADVEELRALVSRIGLPAAHPFWGSRHHMIVPAQKEAIWSTCEAALDAVDALQWAGAALAERMGLAPPGTAGGAQEHLHLARHLLGAPELAGVRVDDPAWVDEAGLLGELLGAGARIQALHEQHDALLRDAAWEADVAALAQAYAEHGPHWWRAMAGPFRQARATLAGLCRAKLPRGWQAQLALLDAIAEVQARRRTLESHAAQLQALYGPQWRGLGSDWAHLAEVAAWLGDLQRQVRAGTVPEEALAYLAREPDRAALAVDA
ncbi:MAG: DUF4011 domain-containing protein, partial [Anaerolineae bacterium]